MHYLGISTYQFIPYYASATRILKSFEDSEPTELKVDIARFLPFVVRVPWPRGRPHEASRGFRCQQSQLLFKQRQHRVQCRCPCLALLQPLQQTDITTFSDIIVVVLYCCSLCNRQTSQHSVTLSLLSCIAAASATDRHHNIQ